MTDPRDLPDPDMNDSDMPLPIPSDQERTRIQALDEKARAEEMGEVKPPNIETEPAGVDLDDDEPRPWSVTVMVAAHPVFHTHERTATTALMLAGEAIDNNGNIPGASFTLALYRGRDE